MRRDDPPGDELAHVDATRVSNVFEDDVDLFVDLEHNFMVNASPTPLERTAWDLVARGRALREKIDSAVEALLAALDTDHDANRAPLAALIRDVDRFHDQVHSDGITGARVRALERAVARFAPYRDVLERSAPQRAPEERRDELLALLENACAQRRLRSAVRELARLELQTDGLGAVRKYLREHPDLAHAARIALQDALDRGHTLESIAASPDSPVRFARTRLLHALAVAMPELLNGLNLEHANAAIVAFDLPPGSFDACALARDYLKATGATKLEKWVFLQLWVDEVLDIETPLADVPREAQNLRKRRDRRHD
jgi:hypothetical protein